MNFNYILFKKLNLIEKNINEEKVDENKRIKYISDFSIIEEKKYIYSNFLFENNKILISFIKSNNIFNEIGILDENRNFVIEYLFETQIKDIYKAINQKHQNNFLSMIFDNHKKYFF